MADYGVSIATLDRIDQRCVESALNVLADQSVAGVVVIAPPSLVVRDSTAPRR